MSMHQFLGAIYETPGFDKTASASESTEFSPEQIAVAVEFQKAAQANNLNLNAMTDEQLVSLWNRTLSKVAEEDKKEDAPPAEEKKDEAAEKKAAEEAFQQKLAEADFFGRAAAHAYVNEMNKIAASGGLPAFMMAKKDEKDEKSEEKAEDKADEAEKKASAEFEFNKVAFNMAIGHAKEYGLDPDMVATKINAAYTLLDGQYTNTKVASAQDQETALAIRALEMLETAGFPVEWKA